MFCFPSQQRIFNYLHNHPSLRIDYYMEKGVTKAVAELAAKRFRNSEKNEMLIKLEIMILIHDFKFGMDRFTKEPLLKLKKYNWKQENWDRLEDTLEQAIMDCVAIPIISKI